MGTWHPGPGIVIAANTTNPEVWDAPARKKLFTIDRHDRPLAGTAISPDGKNLVVVLGAAPAADDEANEYSDEEPGTGTRFETWSISTGRMIEDLRVDREGVTAVGMSKDGSHVYVGWNDGTVDVLETATMGSLRTIGVHPAEITGFEVSPDGALLAATDADGATTIWRP